MRKKGSKNSVQNARYYTRDYISLCERILEQAQGDKGRPQMWEARLKQNFSRGRNVDLLAMADWVGSYIECVWKEFRQTREYKEEVVRGNYR